MLRAHDDEENVGYLLHCEDVDSQADELGDIAISVHHERDERRGHDAHLLADFFVNEADFVDIQ